MAKVYGTEALLRESRALLDATGVQGVRNPGLPRERPCPTPQRKRSGELEQ